MASFFWQADTGFTLTTFQGKVIRRERIERFGNLVWRPRPPCLLSHTQIKQIKKDLKKYSPSFEREDKIRQTEGAKVRVINFTRISIFQKYQKSMLN